jgi:prevent-host-death family protein
LNHRAEVENDQKTRILVRPNRSWNFDMASWQVQDAKSHFSEVIERAHSEGPQTITRHGTERAVVLSIEEYRLLAAQKPNFRDHLLGGPKFDDFEIERDPDTGRDIEF